MRELSSRTFAHKVDSAKLMTTTAKPLPILQLPR